jgi:preprotein translocase subunit SecD
MATIGVRVWILLVALFLALLAISPSFKTGIQITSVERNSTAFNEGLRSGMQLTSVNGVPIETQNDYTQAISSLFTGINETKKVVISTKEEEFIFFTSEPPELTIGEIPRTRIKTGLDLSGGARALIKPENVSLTFDQTNDLVAVIGERLNIYGIKDVTIRAVRDLAGSNFILVEIAGATPTDIQNLLANQGKFSATVGNTSVFEGGKNDISDVCRNNAQCARITSCFPSESGGNLCNFEFVVYLTADAARRHAAITKNISLDESGQYLKEKLYLYIDGQEVDSLLIGSDLRGQVTTEILIRGSGAGVTEQEAYKDAQTSMHRLQTVLITGSLPYKLEIVKLDTISPLLGEAFTQALLLLGIAVFIVVSVALFARYRKIKITLSVILTMFSEAFITLGIAALIGWNLDAPSIAGIIAGMGTGVNDQIVIIDESTSNRQLSIRERIRRALFIIVGAFATIIAAMLPLFWAGAGLLRGFALTTIIGVTVGILITRPAFAEIVRKLED